MFQRELDCPWLSVPNVGVVILALQLAAPTLAQNPLSTTSPKRPSAQFIPVERDVRLEVLDWGGTGRPVVLLAGLGGTELLMLLISSRPG